MQKNYDTRMACASFRMTHTINLAPRDIQDASSSLEPTNCALLVGLTYLGSALLGLVLKNLVGRRLLILASQLGMAVSHLGLGLYFHHLAELRREEEEGSGGAQTGGTGVRGNVTGSWSKEEASLGVVGWLPLPLLLSFTVSPIVVLLDRGLLCVGIFVCLSVSQSWRCLLVSWLCHKMCSRWL